MGQMEMRGLRHGDLPASVMRIMVQLLLLALIVQTACDHAIAAGHNAPITVELLRFGTSCLGEQYDATFKLEKGDALVITWYSSAPIVFKVFGPCWDVVMIMPSMKSDIVTIIAQSSGHHTVRWTNPSRADNASLTYMYDVRPPQVSTDPLSDAQAADAVARARHAVGTLLASTLVFLVLLAAFLVQLHVRSLRASAILSPGDIDELLGAICPSPPCDVGCDGGPDRSTPGLEGSQDWQPDAPSPVVRVLRA